MIPEIRAAHSRDCQAIATITNAIINDTLVTFTTQEKTPAEIGALIDARGPAFIVADLGGRVVGFATYGPFRSGPGYDQTKEHSIQISPDAQGHGVGRLLMEHLERIARADDLHVLIAGISASNPRAVEFHRALGFDQVGYMPEVGRKWGKRLDLILMQKRLF